ncbi:response regulator transcription factor [Alcanivorax sp. JB21]|uniref:response regulator transcription factor n=1 Tax=Alcanivorax limicola TaxID=2874102 RepID=UPI001CBFECE8|nr:response regulator transcription factor [Alcanivorax limicola]MBZ2188475.1 response regulator transcription factor [Alcanivorax limicola]
MDISLGIIVVEDDPRMRERFEATLTSPAARSAGVTVLAWAATAAEALRQLARHTPDVVLVDLGLPDASGITVIQEARRRHPACDIMVISIFADQRNVLASIEAGATGYLLKDDTDEDYVARILELRAGGSPITPIIARQLLLKLQPTVPPSSGTADPAAASLLSPRESEVLNLLARGFAYQEIAQLLGVSPHTIGTYVKRIYEKLQVRSRGEAIYEAQCMGLLAP